jgi:hypothetical protein
MSTQTQGGDARMDGSELVVGDGLTVTASAFDYERLQICRPELQMPIAFSQLSGEGNHTVPMQHQYSNMYRAELPSAWMDQPGRYTLLIDGGAVTLRLVVTRSNQNVYVAAGIGGVRCCMLRFLPCSG